VDSNIERFRAKAKQVNEEELAADIAAAVQAMRAEAHKQAKD
jgi:hypothetical protein